MPGLPSRTRTVSFQSTPLMRGETELERRAEVERQISIHSPHARGDFVPPLKITNIDDFNPLPSCEGRPAWKKVDCTGD